MQNLGKAQCDPGFADARSPDDRHKGVSPLDEIAQKSKLVLAADEARQLSTRDGGRTGVLARVLAIGGFSSRRFHDGGLAHCRHRGEATPRSESRVYPVVHNALGFLSFLGRVYHVARAFP